MQVLKKVEGKNLMIEQSQIADYQDTGWVNGTLINGWANNGGVYNIFQYRKIGNLVYLRGLIKRTTGSNNYFATLPSGFVPTLQHIFTRKNEQNADIYIEIGGAMRTTNLYTTNNWLSLDGLMFAID